MCNLHVQDNLADNKKNYMTSYLYLAASSSSIISFNHGGEKIMLVLDIGSKKGGLDGHGSVPILAHIVEVQYPIICCIARGPVVD